MALPPARPKERTAVSEIRIPLDPLNPGQFFACCGLFELLSSSPDQNSPLLAHFEVHAKVARRAEFIIKHVEADLHAELIHLKQAAMIASGEVEPSIAPLELRTPHRNVKLDWWLDKFHDATTDLKCWAGQVKSKILLGELLSLLPTDVSPNQLFSTPAMSKSKFGIDPRSAWNALDFGFSPNEHNKDAATYPAVEVLGCLGLQAFRPRPRKRTVDYYLWHEDLSASVASLAAFYPWSGLSCTPYQFEISKRGQSYKFFAFSRLEANQDRRQFERTI
jgi:CRISPR-associated protein Csx14